MGIILFPDVEPTVVERLEAAIQISFFPQDGNERFGRRIPGIRCPENIPDSSASLR